MMTAKYDWEAAEYVAVVCKVERLHGRAVDEDGFVRVLLPSVGHDGCIVFSHDSECLADVPAESVQGAADKPRRRFRNGDVVRAKAGDQAVMYEVLEDEVDEVIHVLVNGALEAWDAREVVLVASAKDRQDVKHNH